MEPRGPQGRQSNRHSQRPKPTEDFHRPTPQGGGYHPPADPRERDRLWPHLDPRYRAHLTSPPHRPEYPPLYSPEPRAAYSHDRPEQTPPKHQFRHGYDPPPQGSWNCREDYNYREDYNHYGPSYYPGFYEYPDAGQWTSQESKRADLYHDWRYKQEHAGRAPVEQYRYDQGRDGFQHDFSRHRVDQAEAKSDNYGEASYYDPGTLFSSKTSGLSSSSYELSQYINGTGTSDSVEMTSHAERVAEAQVAAPLKYPLPHAVVSFGPAGQVIRVSPGLVMQGDPGLLEIHSLEVILGETAEQQEMRDFPGPLAREDLHKVDAISFALQRAEGCMRDENIQDRESAALLWNSLILLCRQNGRIVGSDMAELLMQNCPGGSRPDPPSLIDLREDPSPDTEVLEGRDLMTGHGPASFPEDPQQALEGYTKLLLAGRKKEALEAAMKSGLWGHALFLASKMDSRSYTTVLTRFTGQLAISDPLQTLFQLLSRRIPAVSTCFGNDQSGDWKPHLAIMLSNETEDVAMHQKSIMTLGDTLSSQGLLHAAHVCYLAAGAPFGMFTSRTDKLVLLSSSHSLPFLQFCTNQAIQCTELFEYCQRLGDKSFSIPSFQAYKFLYACRLLDCGLVSQAFHYCEVVGGALVPQHEPSPVLLREVIKLAERLGNWESGLREASGIRPDPDPEWLRQLRLRHQGIQMRFSGCSTPHQPPTEDCSLAYEENTVHSGSEVDDSVSGEVRGEKLISNVDLLGRPGMEMKQTHIRQVFPSPAVMPEVQPALPLVAGAQDCTSHNTRTVRMQSAPPQSAPLQQAFLQQAPPQSAPLQQAFLQQAPPQLAPPQSAPLQQAPPQLAPLQQAFLQQAPPQLAPLQQAPPQLAPLQQAFLQQAPPQLAPLQQAFLQQAPPQLAPLQLASLQPVSLQLAPPQLAPPQLAPPQLAPPQLAPPQLAPLQPVWSDSSCGVNSGAETFLGASESQHVMAEMDSEVHAGMPVTKCVLGQQTVPQDNKSTESAEVQPKHNAQSGWFGWFKSQSR